MVNPIQLKLVDLISLKNRTGFWDTSTNKKNTYIGFGDNKSIFKSRGLNFQEVRQYQPGDDIRQIDWRVTAKYGKPFTKLYSEDKEKEVYILCDMRPSMQFASHGHFKSVIAGRLAAFIGFLAEKKNDALAYQILSKNLITSLGIMPSKDSMPHFLNQLVEEHSSESKISFNQIIPHMEQNIRSGSLIFILSDFHDINEENLKFLGEISRQNTVNCIHIYDKMEMDLPKGILPFSDGNQEVLIDTQSNTFQKSFHESWQTYTNSLRKAVQKYHWGYLPLSTNSDYLHQFQNFCMGES